MSENLTVGQLIRERRIAQALSLGQLASKLGVPPASVRAWERSDEELPPKLVGSLAEVLGVEEAVLAPSPVHESEPEPAADVASSTTGGDGAPTAVESDAAPSVVDGVAEADGTEREEAAEEPGAELAEESAVAPPEEPDAEPAHEPAEQSAVEPAEDVAAEALAPMTADEAVDEPVADADGAETESDGRSAEVAADAAEPPDTSDATEAGIDELPTGVMDPPVPIDEAVTAVIEPPVPIDEATTQVIEAPVAAAPTVDDLASTEAVDALLAGTPTSYATATTGAVVGAPVAVIAEKPPYWKDPNQRWRYWLRAVATVAVLGVFLYVLGWALGELQEAFGGFLDQFSDAGETDPLNR